MNTFSTEDWAPFAKEESEPWLIEGIDFLRPVATKEYAMKLLLDLAAKYGKELIDEGHTLTDNITDKVEILVDNCSYISTKMLKDLLKDK